MSSNANGTAEKNPFDITEKMVRAGVLALYNDDWGMEPGEWTVKRVYEAMERARLEASVIPMDAAAPTKS